MYDCTYNINIYEIPKVSEKCCVKTAAIFLFQLLLFSHCAPHLISMGYAVDLLFSVCVKRGKMYAIAFWHALAIFLAIASSFHLWVVLVCVWLCTSHMCENMFKVEKKNGKFVLWSTFAELQKMYLIKFVEPNFSRSVTHT